MSTNPRRGKDSPNWKGYWDSSKQHAKAIPAGVIRRYAAGDTNVGVKGVASRWTHVQVGDRTGCGYSIKPKARLGVHWDPTDEKTMCRICRHRWEDGVHKILVEAQENDDGD